MILSLVLLVTLTLITFITYRLKRLKLYEAASSVPGPKTWPLIGNANLFFGETNRILDSIIYLVDNFPSLFRVWLADRLFFVVYDPDHMKAVLNSPKTLEKEDLYKFVQPWLGTGLFTAPAQKWRKHRKLILPTFNQRILDTFITVFDQQSKILVEQMSSQIDGGEFEIFDYVSLCTLDIICETAMGVPMNAQINRNCKFVDYVKKMSEIIYKRMFHVWLHPDFIFNRTEYGKVQKTCLEYMHNITDEVIQRKKLKLKELPSSNGNGTFRKAFLDLLMELSHEGAKLTDSELREEVDTMMIAGNDTTASVNTFVLLMLAIHPEVQEKAYNEICEVYAHKSSMDECLSSEDLQKLEYTERVIKETMRIFPVGPILVRKVSDDFELDDKVLPKGSSIVLGIIKTHRDEKYWPDPLKFDPDRFLPEQVAQRNPYSYLPFSGGPRNCLGIRYAMMAMKVLIANVLKEYVVKKEKLIKITDVKLKADIILKPFEPIKIKIEKRSL